MGFVSAQKFADYGAQVMEVVGRYHAEQVVENEERQAAYAPKRTA